LYILEVKNLTKDFDGFMAVKGVDFSVKKGEIFGFLGPNGAGKTTTINMLTGLARPTSGSINLAGEDGIKNIKKLQQIMGIVPDESNLYDDMNGFDNLTFCASLYGMEKAQREKRAKELLEQFRLADTGKKPFKAYSKGMKRKLTIAAGIIHDPQILFLDEPTTGIDVESARQIRKLILSLNKKGTTIFLTTHYIEEAERLCSRVGFIVSGRIVRLGTVDELMQEVQNENTVQFSLEGSVLNVKEALKSRFSDYAVSIMRDTAVKIQSSSKINLIPFIKFFEDNNIMVYEAKIIRPSLEEVFVKVTGIELKNMKQEKEGVRRRKKQ